MTDIALATRDRTISLLIAGLTAVLVIACGEPDSASGSSDNADAGAVDGTGNVDGAGSDVGSTGPDTHVANNFKESAEATALYAPGALHTVDIVMPAADWDAVRKQKRNLDNFLEPGCRDKPWGSNFTYRKATVTMNGTKLTDVGVRKKGFVGSMSDLKPSLKLKFNKFKDGQLLHGLERLTLNNNRQDRSFVRTCLSYAVFAAAGAPAPRCNFAKVTVNGQLLGLYSNVEPIKKRMLSRSFGDNDGDLYEGTLSDFRDDWTATFESKTSSTDTKAPAIHALKEAAKAPDDKLLDAIGKHLDVPAFLRFWAAEVLVNHFDGYAGNANNFYVYKLPKDGKLRFIPWGADATFKEGGFDSQGTPTAVLVRSTLTRGLYDHTEGRKLYLQALAKARDEAWKADKLTATVQAWRKTIADVAKKDVLHGALPKKFDGHIADVLTWIEARKKRIDEVIAQPPMWPKPLPGMLCFKPSIKATGTFATTFDTLDVQNAFNAGKGTVNGVNDGTPFTIAQAGAKSGYNKQQPHRVEVQVLFPHPTIQGVFVGIALTINKKDVTTGKKLVLEPFIGGRGGFMFTFHVATKKLSVAGVLWKGTITFTKVGQKKGDKVEGSFDTEWVAFGGA